MQFAPIFDEIVHVRAVETVKITEMKFLATWKWDTGVNDCRRVQPGLRHARRRMPYGTGRVQSCISDALHLHIVTDSDHDERTRACSLLWIYVVIVNAHGHRPWCI